jgi:hypothetical protein
VPGTEGDHDRLEQRGAAIDYPQPHAIGIEPAIDQVLPPVHN